MSILTEFLNPIYLNQDYINDLKETMRAKPNTPYIVLDNFFKADVLSRIIEEHSDLRFDLHADSTEATNRKIRLPFDGAAADCDSDSVLGKLLYSKEWYQFCSELVQVKPKKIIPVIKIRFNAENARGYWPHNDKAGAPVGWERFATILGYFNKDWTVEDGGLLQIWSVSPLLDAQTPTYDHADYIDRRLDMLDHSRINVLPFGATWESQETKDLILVDQILPSYNRIVLFNLNEQPLYHSVTPNNGKKRTGFIQWLNKCV